MVESLIASEIPAIRHALHPDIQPLVSDQFLMSVMQRFRTALPDLEMEFLEMSLIECEGIRNAMEKLVGYGNAEAHEVETRIELQRDRILGRNIFDNIVHHTNNFRTWWEGGLNRQNLEKVLAQRPDHPSLERCYQLLGALDIIITDRGYAPFAPLLSQSAIDLVSPSETNRLYLQMLGDVYWEMRKLGFERELLTQ